MEDCADSERICSKQLLDCAVCEPGAGFCDGQTASLSRHTTRDFDRILLGHLDRMLATPRKPMPDVAWDFWRQFEEAERLEELRQVRPSAFKALPRAPEASVIEREERDR